MERMEAEQRCPKRSGEPTGVYEPTAKRSHRQPPGIVGSTAGTTGDYWSRASKTIPDTRPKRVVEARRKQGHIEKEEGEGPQTGSEHLHSFHTIGLFCWLSAARDPPAVKQLGQFDFFLGISPVYYADTEGSTVHCSRTSTGCCFREMIESTSDLMTASMMLFPRGSRGVSWIVVLMGPLPGFLLSIILRET